jgi:hypothetical protein
MKRIVFVFLVAAFLPQALFSQNNDTAPSNVIEPSVQWNRVIGRLTADHWGLNSQSGEGFTSPNEEKADFYRQVKPGVLRIMTNITGNWVKDRSWDTLKIKTELDNARHLHRYAERIMLCLYSAPPFINSEQLPLANGMQEDSLATFFAQLPSVIKAAGHHIDLYEFFNEKDGKYGRFYDNSGKKEDSPNNLSVYWRLLNKIAIALKAADPSIKVGGPATAWPWEEVYKGFIDECGNNMDFVSFHLYLTGKPGSIDNAALFEDLPAKVSAAGAVAACAESKGKKQLEIYLDEWQVSYEWKTYEPLHDNHVGASWMACYIKGCALKGITGMNVWDYGFHPQAATFLLYSRFSPYLRGNMAQSSGTGNRIEILPVISADGRKSILFVNKTGEKITVINGKGLLGDNSPHIKGFRLDGATLQNPAEANTRNVVYSIEDIAKIPSDIVLNPYGMVLLTDHDAIRP